MDLMVVEDRGAQTRRLVKAVRVNSMAFIDRRIRMEAGVNLRIRRIWRSSGL